MSSLLRADMLFLACNGSLGALSTNLDLDSSVSHSSQQKA